MIDGPIVADAEFWTDVFRPVEKAGDIESGSLSRTARSFDAE